MTIIYFRVSIWFQMDAFGRRFVEIFWSIVDGGYDFVETSAKLRGEEKPGCNRNPMRMQTFLYNHLVLVSLIYRIRASKYRQLQKCFVLGKPKQLSAKRRFAQRKSNILPNNEPKT